MARMYSRKKGRAKSVKPSVPAQWVEYKKPEVERLVVKLAKDGLRKSDIGRMLRDQYGIPSVKHVTQQKINKILSDNKIKHEIPEDLLNLLRHAVLLREHMLKHKRDATSKHGLELLDSKIRRLSKYYVREKKLPANWKYDPERAKLIVQTAK
jgi:small subunit ribosomal protein S15